MKGTTLRRFTSPSSPELLTFLLEDPASNLFLIADLDQFGLDHPYLSYYGGYIGGELEGVFMVYYESGGLYWHDRAVLASFAELARERGVRFITGCRRQVNPLLEHFAPVEIASCDECIYCWLAPEDFRRASHRLARKATLADVEILTEFYAHNFGIVPLSRQEHRKRVTRRLENGTVYLIEKGGRVVSAAYSSVEGAGMAMIGGVATLEGERNKGYATDCVNSLCADLLGRGFTPHLIYIVGNRPAARVYEKVGFRPIDRWLLVQLNL